jgi:hypothetical protein
MKAKLQKVILNLSTPIEAIRLLEISICAWLIFNAIKFFGVAEFLNSHNHICDPRRLDVAWHLESLLSSTLRLGIPHLAMIQIALCSWMLLYGSSWLARSINFLVFLNLSNACALTTDGGIDLLQGILVLFILCTRTNAKQGLSIEGKSHNHLASIAIKIQICVVYLVAAFSKILEQEGSWRQGTALYYILQIKGYSNPVFANMILSSDVLITVGSLSAIVFQISFGLFSMNSRYKWFAICPMASIHIGIAASIGLVSFSTLMISLYPIFFQSADFTNLEISFKKGLNYASKIFADVRKNNSRLRQ